MFHSRSSQEELSEKLRAGPNLQPGLFVSPGVYVVSHHNPSHTVPHEILITTPTKLPECNRCHGVRFSFKCQVPEKIEECEFLGLEAVVLISQMRRDAEELHERATRSRSLLVESEHFLAELKKTPNIDGVPTRPQGIMRPAEREGDCQRLCGACTVRADGSPTAKLDTRAVRE